MVLLKLVQGAAALVATTRPSNESAPFCNTENELHTWTKAWTYLASTMLRSTSSIDLPCVDTNAPTRLDRFFFSFSHCKYFNFKFSELI